jgi:hypothetical protein
MQDPYDIRCQYLGFMVSHWHLSPKEIDEIGWLDLAGLSLIAEAEIEAIKEHQRNLDNAHR